jgi:hypothetical protein
MSRNPAAEMIGPVRRDPSIAARDRDEHLVPLTHTRAASAMSALEHHLGRAFRAGKKHLEPPAAL